MRRASARMVAGVLAVGLTAPGVPPASGAWADRPRPARPPDVDTPNADDTRRILAAIAGARESRTAADRRAASALEREGDAAYRRRDYGAARRAYSNSYPNDPRPRTYVLAGDSHWRAVVAHQDSPPAGADCGLDNRHFARDLALDVAQHQAVGLALVEQGGDPRAATSPLYRRARESTACLRALASDMAARPPAACVDVERLRACLGAPLIR